MVIGIEKFKNKFEKYSDFYTIIGGTACDLLMSNENLEFRATKDIDMILILEANNKKFFNAYWEFIKEGQYKCGWKNSDKTHFYRFTEPKNGYPKMIELFSRNMDLSSTIQSGIIPIHIDDNISSLSAILLNDDFYDFMVLGRKNINGVSVLDASYIIPFKMFAYLDLCEKKNNGEHVNERDLKKHKYDVFRLLQIVDLSNVIITKGLVEKIIKKFIEKISNEDIPLQQLNLPFEKEYAIESLCELYAVEIEPIVSNDKNIINDGFTDLF